ncbi:MAG TPA: galactokinase [Euzebyales bacterium]|nr:galactokinase [Euzebyales bacterium]
MTSRSASDRSQDETAPSGRERACARFAETYGASPELVVRAPGRVNLIGEHTDHQQGYVLPIAIDRALWLALAPASGSQVTVVSGQAEGTVTLDVDDLGARVHGWGAYLQGMAWALRDAFPLRGWRGAIDSDIPVGAGLSSSAAFELAVARAWAAVADWRWAPAQMARHAQRAENDWVGVSSGIMDQLSCALGRSDHALLIDCRSLDVEHVPLPGDVAVVIMDTGTRRELTGSAYNDRQAECARAAEVLGVDSLRDATLAMVDGIGDPVLRRRARHVVTENARVLAAADATRAGDAVALGHLLNAGHASMRDDFEASGPALDTIVALAADAPGCCGARLTGAGFAGCAIALVERPAVRAFRDGVADGYRGATGIDARLYVTTAADGTDVSPADRR